MPLFVQNGTAFYKSNVFITFFYNTTALECGILIWYHLNAHRRRAAKSKPAKEGMSMKDRLGRTIEYLRISVTDRCNLRCIYCMPEEGVRWVPHGEILSFEEIEHLCRIFAPLGIRRVRITGGEPLVRLGLPSLIARLHNIDGIDEINLTTNGILFAPMAAELKDAGLHGINFSLDTLNPAVFQRITRTDRFQDARAGIDAALALGFAHVKVNCVPVRGINDGEIAAIAALALHHPLEVRFIEMMPIGCGKQFIPVSMQQAYEAVSAAYGSGTPYSGVLGNGPASYYSFPGFQGHVGFISAVTHEFCSQCNRIRLTAEGYLKLCLHYNRGIDLRQGLRAGLSDETLTAQIRAAILDKPDHHRFTADADAATLDQHTMNAIGG